MAKFDSKVFLDGDGNFSQKTYEAFRKAVEQVAQKLGVACPLETEKVVTPKETFHVERWKVIPSPDDQARVSALVKNTVQVVPVTVNKAASAA